jgi:hypothetical protein
VSPPIAQRKLAELEDAERDAADGRGPVVVPTIGVLPYNKLGG